MKALLHWLRLIIPRSVTFVRSVVVIPLTNSSDRDAMDMFRAVVDVNEKSERALGLTEDIIRMNAGHYTVWSVLFFVICARLNNVS